MWSCLVRNLFAPAAARKGPARARLSVEPLEGRALLSASPLGEVVHHHRHGAAHAEVRHRHAEVQIEHGGQARKEAQPADDRGANRREDRGKEDQAERQNERPERHGGLDG
jgi:hypothetical protein